jgi:xylulokinase
MPFASFGAKLRWFTNTYPHLARETTYAIGVKAYMAHWLTGTFATDPSSEPGRLPDWEDLCKACAWSVQKFVPVRAEMDILGNLREELAGQFGLRSPIPVVIGLNDGASATLGSGASRAREGVITLGTNGVIFLVTDQTVPADIRLRDAIFSWPFIQGRWIAGGQTKSGAASLQWYLNWTQLRAPQEKEFFRLLEECVDVPIGSRGITFLPYLMGKGTPGDSPLVTGGFLGLSLQTGRADLGRAVLEGVAFSLRDAMHALAHHGAIGEKLMVTGGGAKSPLWCQIVADVLNQTLFVTEGDSCLGAAMLAAAGIGLYEGIDAAMEGMIPASTAIQPQLEDVNLYVDFYEQFRRRRDLLFELAEG